MTSLVLTVTETLRYRGKLGQWSWVLHRIAGLGTLLFVILHVVDTSWATFYPDLYTKAIQAYKTPLYTVGEFILIACIVYHALNGFRIAIFDARPQWWRRQADAAKLVLLGTVIIMVPVTLILAGHVANYYQTRVTGGFDLALGTAIEAQVPFVIGTAVALAAAFVAALVTSVIPGVGRKKTADGRKRLSRNRYDSFMWSFMRVSGVLIIPLVFGHLVMIHLLQGVFDITLAGHTPVGTTVQNLVDGTFQLANGAFVSTASNFVAIRWQHQLFTGVFIWRIYDILLLALIVIHGFHGARYIINDYVHNPLINRTLRIAALGATVGLILVGALAILNSVPVTTQEMLENAIRISAK